MPSLRHNLTPSNIILALDTHAEPGVSYIVHGGQASGDYTVTKNFGTRPTGLFKVTGTGSWFIAASVELGAATSGFSNEVTTTVGAL